MFRLAMLSLGAFVLLAPTVVEAQAPSSRNRQLPRSAVDVQPAVPGQDELAAPAGTPQSTEPLDKARGFYLRDDGMLVGRVYSIDPSNLNLIPMPNATVTFMQNRRFVGQGRTDKEGQFAIRNTTAGAVYSVFVSSRDSIAVFAAAALKAGALDMRKVRSNGGNGDQQNVRGGERAADISRRNEVRLVSSFAQHAIAKNQAAKFALAQADQQPSDEDVHEPLVVQLIPREDFITAIQAGALGDAGGLGGGGGIGGIGGGGGAAGALGGAGGGGGGAAAGGGAGLLSAAGAALGFAASSEKGVAPARHVGNEEHPPEP